MINKMKTEIITIEASKIKPNPFKKFINKGRLNNDIISQLIEGYQQTTFHENLTGRRNSDGEIELVYGHHRLEAVKKFYGENHKIGIKVYDFSDFSDKDMLIDLIRENMLQRGENFRDILDSVLLAKDFLEKSPQGSKEITAKDIAKFLSSTGKIIGEEQVKKYIIINKNLSPEIRSQIVRGDRAGKIDKNKIGLEVASRLSEFDKKEQKHILKAIHKTEMNKDGINKSLTHLRNATKEIKDKLKKGSLKLDDIPIETLKEEIKQKKQESKVKENKQILVTQYKKYLREAGNRIGDTNNKILQTCAYLEGLQRSKILDELDWEEMDTLLREAIKYGNSYSKFVEKILDTL